MSRVVLLRIKPIRILHLLRSLAANGRLALSFSSSLLVKASHLLNSVLKSSLYSGLLGILLHGLGCARKESECVFLKFLLLSLTHSTSEYILVFLFREVHIIISVRVTVLDWVIPIILPDTV